MHRLMSERGGFLPGQVFARSIGDRSGFPAIFTAISKDFLGISPQRGLLALPGANAHVRIMQRAEEEDPIAIVTRCDWGRETRPCVVVWDSCTPCGLGPACACNVVPLRSCP